MNEPLPPGFGAHKSGLIVPDSHARTREVCLNDDWKRVKRAVAFLVSRDISTMIQCKKTGCPSPAIVPVESLTGFTLRCGCTDRVVQR